MVDLNHVFSVSYLYVNLDPQSKLKMEFFNESSVVNQTQMINESVAKANKYLIENNFTRGLLSKDQDLEAIFENPQLRSTVIDLLVEGAQGKEKDQLTQLIENTVAKDTLMESFTGVQPLAKLNIPLLRKTWAKFVAKDAMKTIVANAPTQTIAYMAPYEFKVDQTTGQVTRNELPYAHLINSQERLNEYRDDRVREVPRLVGTHNAFAKVRYSIDLKDDGTYDGAKADEVPSLDNGIKVKPIDRDFTLKSVEMATTGRAEKIIYFLNVRLKSETVIYAELINPYSLKKDGQVIVRVDLENGTAEMGVFGDFTNITMAEVTLDENDNEIMGDEQTGKTPDVAQTIINTTAYLSTEWNEESWDIGFDIKRQEINIGAGITVNAPVTLQFIEDAKAVYEIDAVNEMTDLMTQTLSQKTDVELIAFALDTYFDRPSNPEYSGNLHGHYGYATDHSYTFNVATMTGFAGGPKVWREELKPVIDTAAIKIMNETRFQDGTFAILGNPVDIALLTNVDWQFKNGNGGNIDGTNVSFSSGVYAQGVYVYKCLQSLNFPAGALLLSFIPSGDKQISQLYLPYSFTVAQNGYRSPNRSNVPALLMNKRHGKFEFTPTTALITIEGNDGVSQFNKGNLWSHEFAPVTAAE